MESFYYLGDEWSPRGGCKQATVGPTIAAWGKLHELLAFFYAYQNLLCKASKVI